MKIRTTVTSQSTLANETQISEIPSVRKTDRALKSRRSSLPTMPIDPPSNSHHDYSITHMNYESGKGRVERYFKALLDSANKIAHPFPEYIDFTSRELEAIELEELFNSYKPITEHYQLEKMQLLPDAKRKYYKNCIYLGQSQGELRSGKGIILYSDGRIYEGFWFKNKKEGLGFEIYTSGNYYFGEFKDNLPEGYGVYHWKRGEIFKGLWNKGQKEGFGIWVGVKGDSFEGYWKDGKPHGEGVQLNTNGDKYRGQFFDGLRHGRGQEWYANGDYYEGEYFQGKMHNHGEYTWKSGAKYIGSYENGMRSGEGTLVDEEGHFYKGGFKNNQKDGYGIYEWPTGNKYRGEYKNDIRDGDGEMIWKDGTTYKGEWRHGIQNGYGELFIPNQPLLCGLFKNNVYVGEAPNPNKENDNYFLKKGILSRPRTNQASEKVENSANNSKILNNSARKLNDDKVGPATKVIFKKIGSKIIEKELNKIKLPEIKMQDLKSNTRSKSNKVTRTSFAKI